MSLLKIYISLFICTGIKRATKITIRREIGEPLFMGMLQVCKSI